MIEIVLAARPMGKERVKQTKHRRKATDEDILWAYADTGSVWKTALRLGLCGQSIHERLVKLGASCPINVFTDAESRRLLDNYERYASEGRLSVLAKEMGRTRQFLARQARTLGLTNSTRRKPWAAGEVAGARIKAAQAKHGHPRGMLGKTKEAALSLSPDARAQKRWSVVTDEERSVRATKAMRTKVEKYGCVAARTRRGSWKAGWREIGGKRKYFRSRWEANYARYLETQKNRLEIFDWQHEPETFWFEAIKRGVRSYLPDFRVTLQNGTFELHEVKGWMDDRSRTTLRRMAKYYPSHRVVLIDTAVYRDIERRESTLIEGWE